MAGKLSKAYSKEMGIPWPAKGITKAAAKAARAQTTPATMLQEAKMAAKMPMKKKGKK